MPRKTIEELQEIAKGPAVPHSQIVGEMEDHIKKLEFALKTVTSSHAWFELTEREQRIINSALDKTH